MAEDYLVIAYRIDDAVREVRIATIEGTG